MRKLVLALSLCVPLLMSVSAGKQGGGGASLDPTVTNTIGGLVMLNANGKLSTVPGTTADELTGATEFPSVSTPEDTSLDTNAVGVPTNNLGAGSTINNCSTTNGTVNDNQFRITDIFENGTTGTPGSEVMEQCIGKREALDDFTVEAAVYNTSNVGGARCMPIHQEGNLGSAITINSATYGLTSCSSFLNKDRSNSNNYRPLFIEKASVLIPSAPTDFATDECISFGIYGFDLDGGITDFNDGVQLAKVKVGYNAATGSANDCTGTVDTQWINCAGTFPCHGTIVLNTYSAVQGVTVTDGGGQIDVLMIAFDVTGDTDYTADGGTDISVFYSYIKLWGKN